MADEIERDRARGRFQPAEELTQCRPIIEWAGTLGIRQAGGAEGMWTAWERADGLVAFEAREMNPGLADPEPPPGDRKEKIA